LTNLKDQSTSLTFYAALALICFDLSTTGLGAQLPTPAFMSILETIIFLS